MSDKRKRIRPGNLLIIIGLAAIVSAGAIWLYNDYEDSEAAEYSLEKAQELFEIILSRDASEISVDASSGRSYIYLDDEAFMGIISIPKLRLNLPVNSEWSYPALKKTPCRFYGEIETNDIVIAAHNYRTHFARIGTLTGGDEIAFTDVEGNRIYYSVVEIVTVNPSDTYDVINSEFDLTLFTCTYNGQARVVVRCLRQEQE